MSRHFRLPKRVADASCIEDAFKGVTLYYAWSDMYGRRDLVFEPLCLPDDTRTWGELQYDMETSRGQNHHPRDMIFAFQVLATSPRWRQGSAYDAFVRMTSRLWKDCMHVPPIEELQKLKKETYLADTMWILLVRVPRACGARSNVPLSRRSDLLKLRVDAELMKDSNAAERLALLTEKARNEPPHPTDGQLYVTASGVLVQGVAAHIVCQACGAKGHHMAHTHEDVNAPPHSPLLHVTFPSWMNVKPMPSEKLALPTFEEKEKGFEVQVRKATGNVPLRLARALKLNGANVKGAVYKCGVEKDS